MTEGTLSDHPLMICAINKAMNSIFRETKAAFVRQASGSKNWKSALCKAFNQGVASAASSELYWGINLEREIVTRLNLESGVKLRNSVADISDSNVKIGNQVGKLSKEVFIDKINNAEECLLY